LCSGAFTVQNIITRFVLFGFRSDQRRGQRVAYATWIEAGHYFYYYFVSPSLFRPQTGIVNGRRSVTGDTYMLYTTWYNNTAFVEQYYYHCNRFIYKYLQIPFLVLYICAYGIDRVSLIRRHYKSASNRVYSAHIIIAVYYAQQYNSVSGYQVSDNCGAVTCGSGRQKRRL